MERDIRDFTRKRRLVEVFSKNPEVDKPDSFLVKSKSNFCPPQNRNKSHISKHEWQDILNSKKNRNIVIKEADKGMTVVIMKTKHYLKMINDHLNDKTTYKMVEANCDAKEMKGIAKIIEKYKDNLTKKEK